MPFCQLFPEVAVVIVSIWSLGQTHDFGRDVRVQTVASLTTAIAMG
jgi:hypothetical protein